jgi:hypothetical protein
MNTIKAFVESFKWKFGRKPVIVATQDMASEHDLTIRQPRKTKSLEQFEDFHRDNPHVYDVLVKIARGAKERGIDQWSIAGAFEVARWEARFGTTDRHFKIRNDFKPHYARLIMEQEKDLNGIFVVRRLTAR